MAFYCITTYNSRYNLYCITGEFGLFAILFMIIILIAILWMRRAIKMRQERTIVDKVFDESNYYEVCRKFLSNVFEKIYIENDVCYLNKFAVEASHRIVANFSVKSIYFVKYMKKYFYMSFKNDNHALFLELLKETKNIEDKLGEYNFYSETWNYAMSFFPCFVMHYSSPAGRVTKESSVFLSSEVLIKLFSEVEKNHKELHAKNKVIEKDLDDEYYENLVFVSAKKVKNDWIKNPNSSYGLKYCDFPGCYIFLIFKKEPEQVTFLSNDYSAVYVGQSVGVNQRVHNHICGRGNGDVYADIRNGLYVYVATIECKKDDLNTVEKDLIKRFDALSSYNRTAGGA